MKQQRCSWDFLAFLAGAWAVCGVLAFYWPREFGFAYLTVISFFATIALGALFWILLHHAVDAAWSVMVRRIWEHLACLLGPIFLLSIPLVFSSHIWREPIFCPLLSPGWSSLLVGISFCVLTVFAVWLRKISVWDDSQGGSGGAAFRRVTFATIPCYTIGFCLISFLGWMSLQAGWVSAIWPVYVFAGSALSSLALTIGIIIWLQPAFRGMIREDHFCLFGKLLFAFTLFWAYVGFSQYLIIWYGNLPAETAFFQIRAEGWAQIATWILIIGHFFVPFLALLPRSSKAQIKILAAIASWLLLMHFVDFCWILLPSSQTDFLLIGVGLVMSLVAIGGTLALVFAHWLGKVPLWPVADHRLKECLFLIDE